MSRGGCSRCCGLMCLDPKCGDHLLEPIRVRLVDLEQRGCACVVEAEFCSAARVVESLHQIGLLTTHLVELRLKVGLGGLCVARCGRLWGRCRSRTTGAIFLKSLRYDPINVLLRETRRLLRRRGTSRLFGRGSDWRCRVGSRVLGIHFFSPHQGRGGLRRKPVPFGWHDFAREEFPERELGAQRRGPSTSVALMNSIASSSLCGALGVGAS